MDLSFLDEQQLGKLPEFLIAGAIGLLIGLERERKPTAKAGLRTFALTSMFGALMAMIGDRFDSPWPLIAGLALIGAMIIAAYAEESDPEHAGTTTVVALLITYGLGALAYEEERHLAVSLALATTALLSFTTEFAGIMQRLERRDLLSILQFGALSVVILPLLPDEGLGPYQALNPNRIWLMVVLISGLSLAGYLALKLVGGRRSAVLLGVFGGMVSTTATTLSYSRYGRQSEGESLATLVILVANLVMMVRLAVLAAVISFEFFIRYALPVFGCAFLAGAVLTFLATRGLQRGDETLPVPKTSNPTELKAALSFGLIFGLVQLLSAWLRDLAGDKGLYLVAVASGLTDVDAITLSTLNLFQAEHLAAGTTMAVIISAVATNQAMKLGFVLSVGGPKLFKRCVAPMIITAVAAAIATALFAW